MNHTCNHTMDSGRPCGAPPLKGKRFCYWHHRLRQDFSLPGTPDYRPPLLESPNSVLVALNHVYLAQSRNLIDPRTARQMNSTLRLVLQTLRQLDEPEPKEMVTNPPDYGAHFGAPKEIAADGAPHLPSVSRCGNAGSGAPFKPAVGLSGVVGSAGDSPAVPRATSPAPSNPFVTNPAKPGIWDPEGCLSQYAKAGPR